MKLEPDDLRDLQPVIREIVKTILDELGAPAAGGTARLAYPEKEAAALLGIPYYVLRDARKRGRIKGQKAGRKWLYGREELQRFLSGDPSDEGRTEGVRRKNGSSHERDG
jgi:excisionase family DNA binding protein